MIAYNLIRNGDHYRREAFCAGLEACGYRVKDYTTKPPTPDDVLLIWNRYGDFENRAQEFERVGARVIIAENGYYSPGEKTFALSLGHHHAGGAPIGQRWAFDALSHVRAQAGSHILICGQRGIGSATMRSPDGWAQRAADKLRRYTKRELRIREHPGKDAPLTPLRQDLYGCHACIVWSSAAGVEALVRGVQVYYNAPHWIAQDSARPLSQIISGECDINATLDYPSRGIYNAFSNQWTLAEIKSGVAFNALLGSKT